MSAFAQSAEAVRECAEDELRALHALAEQINRSNSLEEIYPGALQALRRLTGAGRAAILLLDEGGRMRFAAWENLSERYRAAVEGHSPWAANDAEAQPILVPDPAREPTLAGLRPQLEAEGIAALAFIPIAHQGRLLGKFMLYFDTPHAPPAAQVRLALTVAEYLALAVSRQRAVEEIRRLNAELEARVARRTRQLEEASREMEAFCHSISHDLRAPLRALDGFARILLEDAGHVLDENDRGNLRRIIAASDRMARLMDDLLRLSRVGRAALRPAEVDLGALAAVIVERLRRAAPERRIEVRIEEGLRVRADAGLMRIALENLFENAWKYTRGREAALIEFGAIGADPTAGAPQGGAANDSVRSEPSSSPSLEKQAGERRFFVRDNGAGFDMDHAAKLFSPFQRVHSPGEFEGNGIGLAIVKRIVQRHGGRIWAESAPGRGATFWFTLCEEGGPAEAWMPVSCRPAFPSA